MWRARVALFVQLRTQNLSSIDGPTSRQAFSSYMLLETDVILCIWHILLKTGATVHSQVHR